ncbi:DUF4224 domain-containing protein [Gammaproteobacteria bacterium]|jgi:hypothetical protein|nr:DUF4224 domain-containing protein [Gammaproteobacteria bacterium]
MLWLSPEELEGLTKYKQPQKQLEALNHMGIKCRERLDGSIVVFESDLTSGKKKEREFVING